MGFSIGKVSLAMTLLGLAAVYGSFGVRCFIAWYLRQEMPKDRVHVGAVAVSSICFVLGSVLVQPQFDKMKGCTDSGYTWGQCFFSQNH